MHKILLVDSDKEFIENLKAEIDWHEQGYEIAGTASSVKEAVVKIGKLVPDVVITEIQLPDMSGLELIEQAEEVDPELLFIIVSRSAEFAYAKKALEFNVAGYCVKPLNNLELLSCLKRIDNQLQKTIESNHQVIQEYLFDFVNEEYLTMLNKIRKQRLDYSEKRYWAIFFNGALERPEPFEEGVSLKTGYRNYVMFEEEIAKERLVEYLEKYLAAHGDETIYIGVHGMIDHFNQIQVIAKDAKLISYQYFCQPCRKEHIFFYGVAEAGRGNIKKLGLEISKGAMLFDMDKMDKLLKEIEKDFHLGYYHIGHAMHLNNMCETYLTEDIESYSSIPVYEIESILSAYRDISDMIAQISEKIRQKKELEQQGGYDDSTSNETFREIKEFVNENFDKGISAQGIARQFYLNSCYISQLFKKETGMGCAEYINDLRVKRACRLLAETNMKIGDIAEKVGYNDYFYFSRIFKKKKLVSPSAYRNRGGRHKNNP